MNGFFGIYLSIFGQFWFVLFIVLVSAISSMYSFIICYIFDLFTVLCIIKSMLIFNFNASGMVKILSHYYLLVLPQC